MNEGTPPLYKSPPVVHWLFDSIWEVGRTDPLNWGMAMVVLIEIQLISIPWGGVFELANQWLQSYYLFRAVSICVQEAARGVRNHPHCAFLDHASELALWSEGRNWEFICWEGANLCATWTVMDTQTSLYQNNAAKWSAQLLQATQAQSSSNFEVGSHQ